MNNENASTSTSKIKLQRTPNIVEKEVFIDNSSQLSGSKEVLPMPKNLDNIAEKDRNKLLPRQSITILPDPVDSARLINLDASSPVPSPLISNASAINDQLASAESAENQPKELRTISPRKTIFATRFAIDTNADDMKFYILSKIKNCNPDEILIFKINSRNRASFKIIVPDNLFQQIVNPEFWPKNALVREFIYSERNIARLPHIADTNQKN